MTEQQTQNKTTKPKRRTKSNDELLTLSDVARHLGRTHTTIRRWIDDGLLQCVKLPSGLRAVRKSEVNKFLEGSALDVRLE